MKSESELEGIKDKLKKVNSGPKPFFKLIRKSKRLEEPLLTTNARSNRLDKNLGCRLRVTMHIPKDSAKMNGEEARETLESVRSYMTLPFKAG